VKKVARIPEENLNQRIQIFLHIAVHTGNQEPTNVYSCKHASADASRRHDYQINNCLRLAHAPYGKSSRDAVVVCSSISNVSMNVKLFKST
jgi:hypothetical protein